MFARSRLLLRPSQRLPPARGMRFVTNGPPPPKKTSGNLLAGTALIGLGAWTYYYWLRTVPTDHPVLVRSTSGSVVPVSPDRAARIRAAANIETEAADTGMTPMEAQLARDYDRTKVPHTRPSKIEWGTDAGLTPEEIDIEHDIDRATAAMPKATKVKWGTDAGLTPEEIDYEHDIERATAAMPKVTKVKWGTDAGLTPEETDYEHDIERARARHLRSRPNTAVLDERLDKAAKVATESADTGMTPAEAELALDYERRTSNPRARAIAKAAAAERAGRVKEAADLETAAADTGLSPVEAELAEDFERGQQSRRATASDASRAKRRENVVRAEKAANESGVTSLE